MHSKSAKPSQHCLFLSRTESNPLKNVAGAPRSISCTSNNNLQIDNHSIILGLITQAQRTLPICTEVVNANPQSFCMASISLMKI